MLGAIINEGGMDREAIGRIQIRDSFSLVELPEDGLERLLTKLKDTRVAGKALRLRAIARIDPQRFAGENQPRRCKASGPFYWDRIVARLMNTLPALE